MARLRALALVVAMSGLAQAWPSWLRFPRRDKRSRVISRVLDDVKRGEFYGALHVRPNASPQQLKKACACAAPHTAESRLARRAGTRARRDARAAGTARWPRRCTRTRTRTRAPRVSLHRASGPGTRRPQTRAASAFDALRDAYDVLSEPAARRQYDQQRAFRLAREKELRHDQREDTREAAGGVVGQVWRSATAASPLATACA